MEQAYYILLVISKTHNNIWYVNVNFRQSRSFSNSSLSAGTENRRLVYGIGTSEGGVRDSGKKADIRKDTKV